MRPIRPSALEKEIDANAKAEIPTMIWGGPGIGKSEIPRSIAESRNQPFFDLRINLYDPVDIRGGLKVVEENGVFRTRYGIPEDYPASDYDGTCWLFMDEMTTAPKATQNASLQLTLDRRIGAYKLPPNTIILAAGNRAQDRAAVHEMPTPVKNRFAHYLLEANVDDFVKYAMKNDVHESITSFLRYRPGLIYAVDAANNAFPTPRAWVMLNKKLPFMEDEFYGCASIIGDGPAGEFIAFKSIYKDLPDIDQILQSPGQVKVPDSASVLYAICGALTSRVDASNFDAVMRYAKRMPPEYQVIVVRDALAKDRTLLQHDKFTQWQEQNAEVLL